MITTKYNERGLLTNNPNEHRRWLDNNKEGVDIRGPTNPPEKARKRTGTSEIRRNRSKSDGNDPTWKEMSEIGCNLSEVTGKRYSHRESCEISLKQGNTGQNESDRL